MKTTSFRAPILPVAKESTSYQRIEWGLNSEQNVKPAFFDYDSYEIRPDAQTILAQDASFLAAHPTLKVVVGGYCDDRGSAEYNLALGENRANAAKQALVNGGVSPDRVRTVSYGKEKQFCTQADEACWQQNRRAGFSLDQ